MQKRPYGNTDHTLSILGFGGILVKDTDPSEAKLLVSQAIDHGINYFDVAPGYGNAEEKLGPALEPYRKDVFLACKTGQRDAITAREELERSLKRLRTDYFDLYQFHAMTTQEDFEQVTAPGGALETLVKAREEGLVRHLGFSAHSVEVTLALLDHFDFDSILFPVNWAQFLAFDFGPQVIAKAQEKGVAILALKGLANGKVAAGEERPYAKCWYEPIEDPVLADLALRYTLSQPITAALPPGAQEFFAMAIKIAERFTPISEEEIKVLEEKVPSFIPMFRLET
ncbi:MAG: aldo/keto reductase, partial [Chloroflexota bacterium]